MVAQYPHYLFAIIGGSSVQDENGNWAEAEATVQFLSACREEADGRGTELQSAGGTHHHVTSLVQLPKGAPSVECGATVMVCTNADGTGERIRGTVLRFDTGQLHSRLWL